MLIEPFAIHVPDEAVADLKRHLARTRWPGEVAGSGWQYGTNLDYMRELVAYWGDRFDWRAQEAMLNGFAQFTAPVSGLRVHFIHERGRGPSPLPLLLTHGWPSSTWEMHKVIRPLADPAAHGGDATDAFDVIVPSLVGYGFTQVPTEPWDANRIADAWAELMQQLGYARFGVQGGDWGATVSTQIARRHPERTLGLHLNMLALRPRGEAAAARTPEEEAYLRRGAEWGQDESGYSAIQGSRPQTLAYGLADSPAGLAAWIVEKFRAWSDCDGDVERVFSRDELLTNVSIYWFTNTINSANRLYYEARHRPPASGRAPSPVTVPTAFAGFPRGTTTMPRSYAERAYPNIVRWTEFPSGGHFPNLERPQQQIDDIRAFFRPLRA